MFLKAKNKNILYIWPEHKLSNMSAFWPFIKGKIKIVYNNMYLIKKTVNHKDNELQRGRKPI